MYRDIGQVFRLHLECALHVSNFDIRISREEEEVPSVSEVDALTEPFATWSSASEHGPRTQASIPPFVRNAKARCMIHLAHSSLRTLKLNRTWKPKPLILITHNLAFLSSALQSPAFQSSLHNYQNSA